MDFVQKLTAYIPFLSKREESFEYFFALNIGLSQLTAVAWTIEHHRLKIVGRSTLSYKGEEDLVEKGNRALDQSLGLLVVEPQRILFGVPNSWSVDDNLKEEHLKTLKRMVKHYDLTPMAYVTVAHAVSHYFHKKEGVPPTAVLLGVGSHVEATILRAGKIVDTRILPRSDHLFDDVEKVLLQITDVDVLPSKILLYSTRSSDSLEKIRDELVPFPWMAKLSFLHFPKIEAIDEDALNNAVVFAGAFELDPHLDAKHILSSQLPPESVHKHVKNLPADLGFVAGDIRAPETNPDANIQKATNEALLEDDALLAPRVMEETLPMRRSQMAAEPLEDFVEEIEEEPKQILHKVQSLVKRATQHPKQFLLSLLPSSTGERRGFNKLLILPVVVLLLLIGYVTMVKATVTVLVEPKVLENTTEVIADPNASVVDEEKKVIPGEVIQTTVKGEGKEAATGQKQVGNAAKGRVVIYNLTNARVSLSQGSVLTSSNGLKFTLDTSVQVASQSSSVGSDFTTVIKPGKSDTIGVTASVIGPDSNLPAGNELTVGSYSKSQVVGKIDEALSGGTSKNVTVVTSDDQKKLQAKVINELRQKAVEELQAKLPPGKKIISEALSVVDGKYTFNKQVNDQANDFSLTANVVFKGTSYSDTDLRTIVSKLVSVNVPDNYQLNLQDTETQADVSKVEKDGKLVFVAKFRAKLLPKLNTDEMKSKVRGRGVTEVAEVLKEVENVVGAEIVLSPNLPAAISRMPILNSNITIQVSPK